jgi:hypothetical protein
MIAALIVASPLLSGVFFMAMCLLAALALKLLFDD